jgi:sec-independent protein translocase protein TatC
MEREKTEGEMSLVEHLGELRVRLMISIAALVVCTLVAFPLSRPVLEFLTAPVARLTPRLPADRPPLRILVDADGRLRLENAAEITDFEALKHRPLMLVFPAGEGGNPATETIVPIGIQGPKLRYPSPLDPFMMLFKVSLILGVLGALPVVLWQTWRFMKPGLKAKERKVVGPLLVSGFFLFLLGTGFAYGMTQMVLIVMQGYQLENVEANYDISKYLSLLTTMMLVFGIVFEMPLALLIATRIGLIKTRMLTKYRRHAYVGLSVAAMVLTPTDPFSMIAAYIPMLGLFELSVLLCKVFGKDETEGNPESEATPEE